MQEEAAAAAAEKNGTALEAVPAVVFILGHRGRM
jgi:hypothetical protein